MVIEQAFRLNLNSGRRFAALQRKLVNRSMPWPRRSTRRAATRALRALSACTCCAFSSGVIRTLPSADHQPDAIARPHGQLCLRDGKRSRSRCEVQPTDAARPASPHPPPSQTPRPDRRVARPRTACRHPAPPRARTGAASGPDRRRRDRPRAAHAGADARAETRPAPRAGRPGPGSPRGVSSRAPSSAPADRAAAPRGTHRG